MSKVAILALENGSVFKGVSIGADGQSSGEVVFNTAMTGYQEILTDPSYCQQMVTLTYPHIGNTGVNNEDNESTRVWAAGLIIRDSSMIASNWRMTETLPDYLVRNNVVAIAEIDTRRLTRILRESGAQNGVIVAGAAAEVEGAVEAAVAAAKKAAKMEAKRLKDLECLTKKAAAAEAKEERKRVSEAKADLKRKREDERQSKSKK